MCNTAGFPGGGGYGGPGRPHHHLHPQQQQPFAGVDGGPRHHHAPAGTEPRGMSMLTHTPPSQYEESPPDTGKRQRVYMSPGLWSVLDSDPSQGFAMIDTRAAATATATAQQQMQQLQQMQAAQQLQQRQREQQQQQALLLMQQAPAPAPMPVPLAPPHQQPQYQQPALREQPVSYVGAGMPSALPAMPMVPPQQQQHQEQAAVAAAAAAASSASAMESPSLFFYVSPSEQQQATQQQAAFLPSLPAAVAGRAATTDDVMAATYRPVLMTGNTPNSTSSIFCRNTVCNPDADQIILCMSSVLQVQMLHDEGADPALRAQFAFMDSPPEPEPEAGASSSMMETDGASGHSSPARDGEVTVEEIHGFIEGIFTRGRFSAECNIIALVYINRVISTAGVPLHRGNWKALVLVALLLAQKVWNDKGVPLSSVASLLPQPAWAVERIRAYERRFLELLQYRATVTQALYTRYYFELRSLYEKLLEQENISREFPLKPLALWQARKLELCSDSFGLCQRQPPSQATGGGGSSTRPPRWGASTTAASTGGGGAAFQPTTPLTPFPGGPLGSVASAASAVSHATAASAARSARVAVMSPYSDVPQSPSLTYEDIAYQPKGRYVLG